MNNVFVEGKRGNTKVDKIFRQIVFPNSDIIKFNIGEMRAIDTKNFDF